MNVKSLMTSRIVTVELDDSIAVVKQVFDQTKFHHVLVVEAGKLFGVVSDRDLLKAMSHRLGTAAETDRDLATLNKRVHQIMTRKPIYLLQDATIEAAIDVFCDNTISCIPIVDLHHTPVGILSWRDILMALRKPDQLSI